MHADRAMLLTRVDMASIASAISAPRNGGFWLVLTDTRWGQKPRLRWMYLPR